MRKRPGGSGTLRREPMVRRIVVHRGIAPPLIHDLTVGSRSALSLVELTLRIVGVEILMRFLTKGFS